MNLLTRDQWQCMFGQKARALHPITGTPQRTGTVTGFLTDQDMTDHIVIDQVYHSGILNTELLLKPMAAFSEEDMQELIGMLDYSIERIFPEVNHNGKLILHIAYVDAVNTIEYASVEVIDWFTRKGYDIRGWLKKDLAKEDV